MEWKIPLADLDYGRPEEAAVMEVLRSRWLTMGAVTQAFESEFAALCGAPHALAVSNATVALHLACLALGVGPGDEVIVPSLTFVATANAVLYTGAKVRFAEVCGPHDLTIDPASVESLVNERTRAVIPVHYGGYACQMPALLEIARAHGLALIEDAAHAPGASLDGRPLGTWGDIGCFSFFSNKNLSTGEGGMLVTRSQELANKLSLLRSHGMTSLTWDRHHGHAFSYDVTALGYNYRIDEIRSALGRVQLSKLEANNARRRAFTGMYWESLQDTPLTLPFFSGTPSLQGEGQGVGLSSAHLLPILLPAPIDRRALMQSLRDQGIQTSIHYPPIHHFTHYRQLYPGLSLPITEDIAARQVTLPLYPTMGEDAVEKVVQSVLALL